MTDIPETPPEKPRNKGQFVKGDPRICHSGARRKTADGKSLTKLAREHTEEAMALLLEIMRNPDTPSKVRLDCIKELNNRGWGNAHQQITIEGQVNHNHTATINPSALSIEMREQLLTALNQTLDNTTTTIQPEAISYRPLDEGDNESEY